MLSWSSCFRLMSLLCLAMTVGCSGSGPKAPTGLVVAPLSGGAHLTWTDNSADETEFVIERKTTGDFAVLGTVAFNTTAYHDGALEAGATHTYRVRARNAEGTSDPSNEGTLDASTIDMTMPMDMNPGSATCHSAGCRAYSSYCSTSACTCIGVIADNPDPPCTGTTVTCTADPCAGKTASCNHGTGACVVN